MVVKRPPPCPASSVLPRGKLGSVALPKLKVGFTMYLGLQGEERSARRSPAPSRAVWDVAGCGRGGLRSVDRVDSWFA